MLLNLQAPSPLEYFASLVQSDVSFPLLEAVVSLAQDEYPELDLQQVLSAVDVLQSRLQKRVVAGQSVLERIQLLNRFLYSELKFGVNANNYYDPENSFIHSLLQTRRGIPISIGVLWLELARAIQLDAHGVSFPGHFMLKVLLPHGQVVIDPLTGKSYSGDELAAQLQVFLPELQLAEKEPVPLAIFLQNASPREIVARMLRNLKEIYRNQGDLERLLAVHQRLVQLLPNEWNQVRDRGWVYCELNDPDAAIADFQEYLDHVSDAVDAADISAQIARLRLH